MKFIRTNEVELEKIESFFQNNPQIEREALFESGYVIEIKDKISGCFLLKPIKDDSFWLKQLYVTQDQARALPIVLEAILALAKEMDAKHVYANSHQPVVDLLLESLQFCPQNDQLFPEFAQYTKGKWWSYRISS